MSLIFITIILFHRRGRGKYTRGPGKKRTVKKDGWRSNICKKLKNLGLAHENVKTGRVMPEKKVMYCNILFILFFIFIQST